MSSPHDALFKATFSNLENARSELALVLPSEVVERVDWSSLALERGESIDDDFANLASDLLYMCNDCRGHLERQRAQALGPRGPRGL